MRDVADLLLPEDAVRWAIRLMLGREPRSQDEVERLRRQPTIDALRSFLAETAEFDQFCWTTSGQRPKYGVPPRMLRPPANGALPWRFVPPTLEHPVSQLCTMSQFAESAFEEIAGAMALERIPHRAIWEPVWIVSLLATEGLITAGKRGIGFGVGQERIPALLASRGVTVLASDQPGHDPAKMLEGMFDSRVIHREDFDQLVHYHPIDMLDLPGGIEGEFDFLWSASAVQQLGSLRRGMEFIERSLAALKPGGLAVHSMEFNIGSNEGTVETYNISAYRRRDIEALASRLQAEGHDVLPINLHPGHEPEDELIDQPPFGLPHLKLIIGRHILTSFGFAVRKKGGPR
jgi:hypothetical protein